MRPPMLTRLVGLHVGLVVKRRRAGRTSPASAPSSKGGVPRRIGATNSDPRQEQTSLRCDRSREDRGRRGLGAVIAPSSLRTEERKQFHHTGCQYSVIQVSVSE